jgi:hypothetical protein
MKCKRRGFLATCLAALVPWGGDETEPCDGSRSDLPAVETIQARFVRVFRVENARSALNALAVVCRGLGVAPKPGASWQLPKGCIAAKAESWPEQPRGVWRVTCEYRSLPRQAALELRPSKLFRVRVGSSMSVLSLHTEAVRWE